MTSHDPNQDDVRDDVLKQLDDALNVEPSRGFADGVRARVSRTHVRATQMWWGLAAAATVGLAVMTLWRPTPEATVQVAQVTPATTEAPTTAPDQRQRQLRPKHKRPDPTPYCRATGPATMQSMN